MLMEPLVSTVISQFWIPDSSCCQSSATSAVSMLRSSFSWAEMVADVEEPLPPP